MCTALTLVPPILFVQKMSSAFYFCCIYSSALQTRFYHGSKHYELWSSLIWVHSVCNKGYLRTLADERADDKSCDWQENALNLCDAQN